MNERDVVDQILCPEEVEAVNTETAEKIAKYQRRLFVVPLVVPKDKETDGAWVEAKALEAIASGNWTLEEDA